jgi:hypothetical protein
MWTKEQYKAYYKFYRLKNKIKLQIYQKNYRKLNVEKLKIQEKEWTKINKEHLNDYRKEWVKSNKEHLKDYKQAYYLKNKLKLRNQNKIWRKSNKITVNLCSKSYQKERRHSDINFKLIGDLRTRCYQALKNNQKSGHTLELIGCTIEFLKKHLTEQFVFGMSWKNYGRNGWEIDHIKPCAAFNLSKPSEQKKCFNYKNLQPLWANDNRSKGAK